MSQQGAESAAQARRRRDILLIVAAIVSVVGITLLETRMPLISGTSPIASNIFLFGLINVNIILLLLLVFLVLRNVARMYVERRAGAAGSRLSTRLVTSFVAFTIIPTFLLFFVVIGFINRSIDGWFSIRIEESLTESLELAQDFYKNTSDRVLSGAKGVSYNYSESKGKDSFGVFLAKRIKEGDLSAIDVYGPGGQKTHSAISGSVTRDMVPEAGAELVAKALKGRGATSIEPYPTGDVVRAVVPILGDNGRVVGVVSTGYYVPKSLMDKMNGIAKAFEGYKQIKLLKEPVKVSYFTILLIISFVIVFFSIWIGRYIARDITVPIQELAEGTHAVASGNLDFRIKESSKDEIGLLVKSFNRMTEDLAAGKSKLEEANLDLRRINAESEQARRYIEIVLSNIPAGVVSIDRQGRLTSINRVAAEILGIEAKEAVGRNYKEVLRLEERELLREMIREMNELNVESIEKQMRVELKDKTMTVLVNLNALKDESGDYLGMVAVLDDLTHILKTQRMSAWKEVARRIAHEIKNPLTPIKLSAQRLRKKYLDSFGADSKVFDECTDTIIRQVDELKTLVNEFSSFARMPAINPSPNDLNDIVNETVSLYRTAHRNISFETLLDPMLPKAEVDRDQIKRALINLIDNATAAVDNENGVVKVETAFDAGKNVLRVEVADNGCGIPEGAKEKLFEPYFSTKKSGTGLGLAIVSNIIADHNGYIRVRDNQPRGTRFVIELPAKVLGA